MKYLICLISALFFSSCVQSRIEVEENNCPPQLYRFHNIVKQRTYWGYMDIFDLAIIKAKYTNAKQFSEGLAAVEIDDKWGFINTKDSVVIPPIYDWVTSFGEYGLKGIAMVKTNTVSRFTHPLFMKGNTGFINKKGELISQTNYKSFNQPYSGLMVMIGQDDKYGFIDMQAREIIPCIYDSVRYNYPQLDSICVYKNGTGTWYNIESLLKKHHKSK